MLKAIADRVFIRLTPEDDKTSSHIILIDDYHHNRNIGMVESIGSDVSSVKIGDKVLFHIFDELPTPDKDIVVIRESSILGVFEDE
ncbi:MAG: co-chaperone GroES [Alphaproteobacteria bacterium]|nr:co-chaperone GroES [Alphaproteobacteria bacterium]